MGFLFDRRDHLDEPAHIVWRDAPRDRLFQIGEVTVHAAGDLTPLRGGGDDERAAVGGTDLPRDEPAIGQSIQDAGQGGALVREPAMEVVDGGRPGLGKVREDVRLALRQAELTQVGQIEPDPVRRPVNLRNQPQGHQK